METTLNVGGKMIKLRATAALPRLYRATFGRDIIHDMATLQKAYTDVTSARKNSPQIDKIKEYSVLELTIFRNVCYIMAKHSNSTGIVDDPDKWLDNVGKLTIHNHIASILEIWYINTETLSTSKKKQRPTIREINASIFMLRMAELNIPASEEHNYTIGMIEDMLTEHANDSETYYYKATQDYFDSF